jgi:hypothetical protein
LTKFLSSLPFFQSSIWNISIKIPWIVVVKFVLISMFPLMNSPGRYDPFEKCNIMLAFGFLSDF